MNQDESPPISPETLTDTVAAITMKADDARVDLVEDEDRDGLLRLYADATRAAKMLLALADECQTAVRPLMPTSTGPRGGKRNDPVAIDGLGIFQLNTPAIRTEWDENTLAKIIDRGLELGEILGPKDVAEFVKRVQYAGQQYKKRELAELGLDPSDLSESQYGDARLRWT